MTTAKVGTIKSLFKLGASAQSFLPCKLKLANSRGYMPNENCIRPNKYVCARLRMHLCVCVCVRVYGCVCMCACRCAHTHQAYCEEESHREHVFALFRRWIYSHDLGIGLHGICDGNAKEGGLAPETDKQGERVISNMPLEAPWQFRAQVLSSFILRLQISNICNNEGCDKSRHHKCANCKLAFYCCKDCQVEKLECKVHKRVCKCIANAFAAHETTLTADLRAYALCGRSKTAVYWPVRGAMH